MAAADRAREIAEAALGLVEREIAAGPRMAAAAAGNGGCSPAWPRGSATRRAPPPGWIRDADRRLPVVSISGTNGKTTTTRLTAHILRLAGHRVGRDDVRRHRHR